MVVVLDNRSHGESDVWDEEKYNWYLFISLPLLLSTSSPSLTLPIFHYSLLCASTHRKTNGRDVLDVVTMVRNKRKGETLEFIGVGHSHGASCILIAQVL